MVVDLGALGVDLGAPVRREHESGWATAPAELYTIIPVGVALRAPPDTPPLAAAMLIVRAEFASGPPGSLSP